jgi:hypothetical protein
MKVYVSHIGVKKISRSWSAILVSLALFFFYGAILRAQACCSGGVPLGGSLGLGAADSKSLELLFTYDYNALTHLVHISEKLEDNSRTRITQSGILELNYGLNQRFSLAAVIPVIRQTRTISGYDGSEDFIAAQGLGDMVFLLKYRIIATGISNPLQWVIGLGPKLPTGKTNFTNDKDIILAADMQPGSGSLDGIAWSFLQRDRLFIPSLGVTSVLTYRYSGTNKDYNDVQNYRFGNEFQFNLGANYNFVAGIPITLFLFGRYRHQTPDYIDGNVFPSSGGQWVYAIPGVNIQFMNRVSLRLSSEWPLYRKLEGTQLTTGYKFSVSISTTLPTREKKELIFQN